MSTSTESEAPSALVALRGGLVVPVSAIVLLIDLESRGVRLERDGGDILIRYRSPVGHEDREALRLHKPAVLALLDYVGSAESVQ